MSETVKTGLVRFSYVSVFEPREAKNGGKPKYEISILVDKEDTATVNAIKGAIKKVYDANKEKLGGKALKALAVSWRDGDDEKPDDPTYAGKYYFTAKSARKVQVVDRKLNLLVDDEEFYSGCYGKAVVHFYPYDVDGNKGIAAGLDSLLKVKDGERLGGAAVDAASAFAEDLDEDANGAASTSNDEDSDW